MERMTWEEIRDAMRAGRRNALLMVGATEQHGPHLPLNTDTLAAYSEGEKICSMLPSFLIAPVITIGYSAHHMSFPGTITLRRETLGMVLDDACHSLDHHGFENIIIITTHGGNIPTIQEYLTRISKSIHAHVAFITLDDFDEIVDTVARSYLGDKLRNHQLHSCHACLHETSFMLAEYPEFVRKNKICRGRITAFDIRQLINGGDIKDLSENGVLGDPTLASRELGQQIENAIIAKDVEKIRSLL